MTLFPPMNMVVRLGCDWGYHRVGSSGVGLVLVICAVSVQRRSLPAIGERLRAFESTNGRQ